MIDWSDQDQARHTLWGEVFESEDHLVPDPKKGGTPFTFGDCIKKRRTRDGSGVSSMEQASGTKNVVPVSNSEDHSSSDAQGDFSAPELDMDAWTDLSNLSTVLTDGYNDGHDLDSFTKNLMNDFGDAPNLNSVRAARTVQQDGEPELFSNEHADKESGIFLDCDWTNIGNFDDFDSFFRDDESSFGHDMLGNEDVFLSPCTDGISSTMSSIHMPVDGQKGLLRLLKKAETRGKPSEKLSGSWDLNSYQSEPLGHFGSSSQVLYNAYGYPSHFPALPHNQAERNQKLPILLDENFHPDPSKYSKSVEKLSDLSRPAPMTPQEKIEKLRRRQQMQAMLAIQQQQQHYGCQITGTEDSGSQACLEKSQSQDGIKNRIGIEQCVNKLPSLEKSLLEERGELERVFSMLIDDYSLVETIYYQLQDSLEKLDDRIRLCIRDSLYRLARSAVERQSTSDRRCTNKSNRGEDETIADDETSKQARPVRLQDPETDTNPIDRIVTNLLFQMPPESCAKSTKVPQSPSLSK